MSLKQPAIMLAAVALCAALVSHPPWPNPRAASINTIV